MIYQIQNLEKRLMMSSQPYSFQNAAIGGGGFVDGVFFSPMQQNVMYARTDIGGLYKTTNAGTNWVQLLDFVGPATSPFGFTDSNQYIGVLSFAIDPQNPNNLYADVGQYSGTNGAVFYSTDGGTTWGKTSLSFYVGGNSNGRGEGERIAVDPHDSNIVFLGSNTAGLWESTNAGHSFSQVSSFSTTASINFVYFNPYVGTAGSATQNIFVGVNSITGLASQTTAAEPTNLYQTVNGGTSWTQVAGSATSPGKNIAPVAVTTLSRSGTTATVDTSAATSIVSGDLVTIAGATPSDYDGTFTVASVTNSTTFTYTIATGTDTATGTITAAVNYSEMPNRTAMSSDGNLYLTYSDAQAPSGTQTTGGVYRYNTSSGTWTVISPQVPGVAGSTQFGYMGIALDPESPTTVVVTSINRYTGIDALWRTTNANAATPTWVALFDTSSSQNYGFGGYNTTRNTSNAAWVARFGDGIGNWPCSVAIDPFSSGHIIYGNGQGLWATNIGNSSVELSGANSWYFPDTGIEFTAVNQLATSSTGVPLFSAIGDIDGFAHTTLTSSPVNGQIAGGGGSGVDVAATNSNYAVSVGSADVYSTNGGTSFTAFPSSPTSNTGGSVAISYNSANAIIAWAPSSSALYYSTNLGTTWTASTGSLPTGGTIVADGINPQIFYYTSENSNNNSLSFYISTDGAHSFTLASTIAASSAHLAINPYISGDLWLATTSGLWHSTNFGSSFASGAGTGVTNAWSLALGKNAPGQTYAALYFWGQINGTSYALYRSDDKGATWVQINDSAHQWGGLVQFVAADPNDYGRVYLATNGRGIIIGDPVTALPAGWSDSDINAPGNFGWSTSSTNLSNGTFVNQWSVNGGGGGITGTADQFNFASESVTGDASLVTQLTALNNPGTGVPQAGLMFRAGTVASNDPFAAIVQTTANQLIFEYRSTSGGAITSTALSSITLGAEYLNLIRSGTAYSAYYGTDGIHWTQLGSAVTIAAIPATANAGLAVTSSYNPQLSSAIFSSVLIVPDMFSDTTGNHNYAIRINPAIAGQLQIFVDVPESSTPTYQIALSQLPSLTFNCGSGSDNLIIDETSGSPVPAGGVTLNSGSGSDSITVLAATAATTANITVNDNYLVNFNSGTGAALNYIPISALNIAPSSTAVLNASTTSSNRSVLITSALNFNGTGSRLNLNGNDIVVHSGNLMNLASQVTQGFNAPATGIYSTTATSNSTHLTTIGVVQNSIDGTPSGTALYSSASGSLGLFDGISTINTDVLVKYTYFGDANLDGRVDGSDYTRLDSAWGTSATGWNNGDFNYDGVLNGSDYTLIDNAFNAQGAHITSAIAAPVSGVRASASTVSAFFEISSVNTTIAASPSRSAFADVTIELNQVQHHRRNANPMNILQNINMDPFKVHNRFWKQKTKHSWNLWTADSAEPSVSK